MGGTRTGRGRSRPRRMSGLVLLLAVFNTLVVRTSGNDLVGPGAMSTYSGGGRRRRPTSYVRVKDPAVGFFVAGSSEEVDITQQESESESAGEEKEQARPSCLLCHQLCSVHRRDKQDGHITSWRCKPCKWQGMKAQSAHCSWFANEGDYTAAGLEPGRKRRVCKPWTSVEQANLQIGIYLFGRQWELVARHVGSRTRDQQVSNT